MNKNFDGDTIENSRPYAWFDANSISATDSTSIATWNDLSGNGFAASQTNSASQPTFRKNQLNGKSALVFDGVNDTLTIASSTSSFKFLHSSDSTIILVGKAGTTADPGANMAFIHTATGTTLVGINIRYLDVPANNDRINIGVYYGTSPNFVINNSSLNNGSFLANTFNYVNFINKPSESVAANRSIIKINNGSAVKNNTSTNTASISSSANLVTFGGYASNFLNGSIAEVIFYNRALTDSELSLINQYLKRKYNI